MNPARKLQPPPSELASAIMVEVGPTPRVRIGDEVFEARRAKSCLVAPAQGDRVLCAIEPDAVFVLAVLTSDESATRVGADSELSIEAPHVVIGARECTVAVDRLGFFGGLVNAHVNKFAVIADELDAIAERVSQRAKRVFRMVEELDQLRAGTVDVRAENLASIRAENALISARVLAKIDGEQINLG